jgi:hypothetical protein
MAIPNDPDTILTRRETAAALTEAGFPTSEATLTTKATRGGGPPYMRYGPRAIYRWGCALTWAKARLTPAAATASAQRRAAGIVTETAPQS